MDVFKIDIIKNSGENWLVADFGVDEDGEHYILTTDRVRASEYGDVSRGAKGDCELVARLLNLNYNKRLIVKEINPQGKLF